MPKLIETLTQFWQAITIVSESGEASRVTNGGLDVNIQDQFTSIVDLYLSQKLETLIMNANTVRGSRDIEISHSTIAVVGHYIEIWQNGFWYQGEIESIALNTPSGGIDTLTMGTPVGNIFIIANSTIKLVNVNMNINGSSTPIDFTFEPESEDKYDIVRGLGAMTHTAAGTDDKFGDQVALTDGLLFFKINPTLPADGYLFNAKTNGDLRLRALDVIYSDKAGPSLFGTSFRRTFGGQDKNGVVVRVDAKLDQYISAKVRANLTGLSSFQMVIQGHLVE